MYDRCFYSPFCFPRFELETFHNVFSKICFVGLCWLAMIITVARQETMTIVRKRREDHRNSPVGNLMMIGFRKIRQNTFTLIGKMHWF